MYKVFDSTNQIIFASSKIDDKAVLIKNSSEIQKLNKDGIFLFIFITNQPLQTLLNWYSDHILIEAAGGLVKKEESYLWIYRNNKWDLPKGKVEKNESVKSAAIREVVEECGLDGSLTIVNPLYTSFHIYKEPKKKILKRTHWYLMNYLGDDKLVPQLEEGITKVVWANKLESNHYASLSFGNVSHVWYSK